MGTRVKIDYRHGQALPGKIMWIQQRPPRDGQEKRTPAKAAEKCESKMSRMDLGIKGH